MEFRVLGPIEVCDGSRLVEVGPRLPKALLSLLLIEPGRVVSVDRILDSLWGEEPPPTAATSLQNYVARLRRALEPERPPGTPARVLVTQPPGYALRVEPDALDAARFEALVERGRSLLDAGRCLESAQVLGQALALWRGSPYADLGFEAFLQPEIARLGQLRATAQELLADATLAAGDHARVATELERLVAGEPLRERRWELYALALYRGGRQADALRALDRARRTLAEELGIEPGPSLRQLEHDILNQSPALEWQPLPPDLATAPTGAAAEPGTPLVGREGELSELLDALAQAIAGWGRVIVLAGEPGIGKTRLAEELAARAAREGAIVVWGRCHAGEGAPAFWPWMQTVRALVERLDPEAVLAALGPGAAEIAQIVPEVKEAVPDLPPVTAFDPATARARLYDALSRFLLRVAARRPLVMILDDLHWADAPSIQLFSFFASQLKAVPVVVVAAYREGEVGDCHPLAAALITLSREPNVARLGLGGLVRSDVARLLALSSPAEATDELVEAVWARTEGNPLFVAELVRLLDAQGSLGHEVPTKIRDVIRRRLTLLPDDTGRLLGVASVLGRDFDLDVVARVGEGDLDTALELVEPALNARLILEVPGAVGSYRFSHALIRETLYDGLGALRRARLHQRVAEALEAQGRADPVELAHHYWQAAAVTGGAHAALAWAERAAEQARARLAYEQAEDLLNRAVALLGRLPSGPDRDRRELDVQSRLCLLQVMTKGKGASEVGRSADRAAALGRALGDPSQLGRALYRLASFHAMRGEINAAGERSRELLDVAESSGDRLLLLLGRLAAAYSSLYLGRLGEARADLEQALALSDLLHDVSLIPMLGQHPAVGAWGYQAMVLALLGDDDRAIEVMEGALAVARRLGHPFTLAYALHYDAWLGVIRADATGVHRRAQEAVDAWRQGGFGAWRNAAGVMLGWARARCGEPEAGVAMMADNMAAWEASGARRYLHFYLALLGEANLLAFRPDNALLVLDRGLREAAQTGERFYEAELHRLSGEALAQLAPTRGSEAEPSLRRAVAVAREQGAALLERRARASLEAFQSRTGPVS